MAPTPITEQLRVIPANEASWADIQAVFGPRGDAHGCQCQWFKVPAKQFGVVPWQELEQRQRELTHCGEPTAKHTTGLVAYLGGEPVGWVAVEPRINYVRMQTQRIPWLGRDEDKADAGVWAVSCFVTRVGFRGRGLMAELAAAAAGFARDRGASAAEGYPLVLKPGERLGWGELYVGAVSAFAAAGFREVSRPSPRRAVMRIDFSSTADKGARR
ncbi:GNAT family N-acetyltransferase [Gryllotalpicola protaetiae]|uniref:GNAT family N-acetyltransferase n=1 Tax=Gryllotalpicola protaetiae TaxID=2419771 RepID=A0A387BKC2_9MICO|nr:GNAT family N-acetyltransferase [Gryllotalpicola protaetiae]AYG04585.1 GNAT family N-acetyltransferase [Gryllotalpicola protaetiae]